MYEFLAAIAGTYYYASVSVLPIKYVRIASSNWGGFNNSYAIAGLVLQEERGAL